MNFPGSVPWSPMTTSTKDLHRLADLMKDMAGTTKAAALCTSGRQFEQLAEAAKHVEAAARNVRRAANTNPAGPVRHFGKR